MGYACKIQKLSIEEYLKDELTREIKHEYIDGQIYAMSGGTRNHNIISGNLYIMLRDFFKNSSCDVFINDVKLFIPSLNIFYYPDVMIFCDKEIKNEYYCKNPCLVAEVLSPSTELTDRREKWLSYQHVSSLKYYLIVHSDKILIEIYSKDTDNLWNYQSLEQNNDFYVNCHEFNGKIDVNDIYNAVET